MDGPISLLMFANVANVTGVEETLPVIWPRVDVLLAPSATVRLLMPVVRLDRSTVLPPALASLPTNRISGDGVLDALASGLNVVGTVDDPSSVLTSPNLSVSADPPTRRP